jgi:hypothetical protein
VQVKGIFARNLATLELAAPNQKVRDFLQANAESIWRNQSPDHHFGPLVRTFGAAKRRNSDFRREASNRHGAARWNRGPEVLQDDVVESEGQHHGARSRVLRLFPGSRQVGVAPQVLNEISAMQID